MGTYFFCRNNSRRPMLFDRFEQLKKKKSFFSHSSVFGVVRAPLSCINSSFSDDPIAFLLVFRNLKFSPKIDFFSPFCLTLQVS